MRFLFLTICVFYFSAAQAQLSPRSGLQPSESLAKGQRFISVNGYAEKEVSPDIIFISITIKEYFTDNSMKHKQPIDELEKSFLRTAYDAGIKGPDITIEGISGYGNWGTKKKTENFLASKRYQLKLSDLDKINDLMTKVDPKAVASMYVSGYDYSKIADIKKALRTQAMKDARSKASYMITALDETLGPVLEAEEQDADQGMARPLYMSKMAINNGDTQSSDLEFKKVKVSSTVKVTFQIQ